MVSYFKSQWLKIIFFVACIVVAAVFAFQPHADSSTVEGLEHNMQLEFAETTWLVSAGIWLLASFSSHHDQCLMKMDKRLLDLESSSKRKDAEIRQLKANQFRPGDAVITDTAEVGHILSIDYDNCTANVQICRDGWTLKLLFSTDNLKLFIV